MKIAVSVGQTQDGKWQVLQFPDVHIRAQKQFLKGVRVAGGKVEKTQFSQVGLAIVVKKYSFGAQGRVFAPRVVDDLTGLAEEGLKKVIAGEKLGIKFSADHEAVREAIRQARKKQKA